MASRLDDLLDAAIVLGAAGLHVLAVRRLDALPPTGTFETLVLVLPLLAQLVAVVLLVVRRDRRGLQGACLLQWLLVLYTLPASFLGLNFVPGAAVLTLALYRPRRLSSARSDEG